MRKKFLIGAMAMALLLLATSLAMGAIGADKRLGYGFEPGLVPGKDFVAGQLIVGLKPGMNINEIKLAVSKAGVRVAKEIQGAVLLEFSSEQDAVKGVAGLLKRSDVAFVERNGIVRLSPPPKLPESKCGGCDRAAKAKGDLAIQSVSSDVGTGYQWHHTVIRKTAALPALSATPPTVAVIDTGVDYTHPDLSGKVYLGKNCVANNYDPMDDHGHGTHCAGIIGAIDANGVYGEGVCPNCKILAIKVLDGSGSGSWFDVAAGMQYARLVRNNTNPVTKVISMSLGGGASALIAAEVDNIKGAGMVLVAAAGNDNTTSTASAYPGADPDTALRVMATDYVDCRAWFSNFSPAAASTQYNIAAPGWQIYSTLPEAGFGPMSGTSMATPVVAGAAALVWGQIPALTRSTLITRLYNYGRSIGCGFAAATRRVDVRKAILGTSETAVVGHVIDPWTGKAPSPSTTGAAVYLRYSTTSEGTDATNRGGSYEITSGLTAGSNHNLYATKSAYISTFMRYPITIGIGNFHGPYMDALPKSRSTSDVTILLDWNKIQPAVSTTGCTTTCLGWEFDLMVKQPSGTVISWANKGDLLTSPYVYYPRDSAGGEEGEDAGYLIPMETIVVGGSAANGTYKVFVDRSPYDGSLWNQTYSGSAAAVQVYKGASALSGHYYIPGGSATPCTTQRYWYVGDIVKSGTTYTWTSKNLCQAAIP